MKRFILLLIKIKGVFTHDHKLWDRSESNCTKARIVNPVLSTASSVFHQQELPDLSIDFGSTTGFKIEGLD